MRWPGAKPRRSVSRSRVFITKEDGMRRWSALVFVALLLSASTAFAQNAQITGTVKDQSGGVMPGVTVTAKNKATGLMRTEVTDAKGAYRLVALLTGGLLSHRGNSGFHLPDPVERGADHRSDRVHRLHAQAGERVGDGHRHSRDAGRGRDPIRHRDPVDDGADSGSSDCRAALDRHGHARRRARRRTRSAASTTAATSSIGAGVTNFYSTGNVVDGVNNTWVEQGETRQNFPMDAIQEFKVSTSSYKAEYGLATGGVVNVVTKTGTNDLHFSGFYFYRNQAMTERQYFQTSAPPYSRGQEGGLIGGPVIKDKIHYFFSYERTDEKVYNSVSTPAWPQYTGTYQSKQYRWTYLGRGDVQLPRDQSLFVRFGQEYQYRPELTVGGSTIPSSSFDFSVPRTSAVVGHTWVINDRALNDFRFQYTCTASTKWHLRAATDRGTPVTSDRTELVCARRCSGIHR